MNCLFGITSQNLYPFLKDKTITKFNVEGLFSYLAVDAVHGVALLNVLYCFNSG